MSKLIRILLFLILGLVLTVWLAFGLFRPEYLKAPIAEWFLRQTGEPLIIGRLEYNPFYPNIVLAEQIKWGERFSADKIYLEIAHGSWKNPSLEIAHLDVIHPRLQLNPAEPLPALPLKNLKIRDLNLDGLTLLTPGGENGTRLGNLSLQLDDWQPLADGQWQPLKAATFSLDANQIVWRGWHLGAVALSGKSRDGLITIDKSEGKLLDGTFSASFNWNTAEDTLTLQELQLQGQRLELASLPALPWRSVELQRGELNDISLTADEGRLNLNHLTARLQDLRWQQGAYPQGQLEGTLGELAYNRHSISEIRSELKLQPDGWQGKLAGELWEGKISLSGHYAPATRTLTLDEATLDKLQGELPADWRESFPSWPLEHLILRRLDGHHLSWLSFDESLPFSLKGGELFITDLDIGPDQLQPYNNQKARIEASWGELIYRSLTSRGGEADSELTPQGWQLRSLSLPLEQGKLTASGFWSREAATPHQLTLEAQDLDVAKLAPFWPAADNLSGNASLQATLRSQGGSQIWWRGLDGSARLDGKDLFLGGIKLDDYLEQSLSQPAKKLTTAELTSALQGGDTAINQLALALKANQGVLSLSGTAASITHQIALRGSLTLAQQEQFSGEWHSEWALLNSKGCAESRLAVNGPLLSPALQQQPGGDCQWPRLNVPYPPQGRQGKLR